MVCLKVRNSGVLARINKGCFAAFVQRICGTVSRDTQHRFGSRISMAFSAVVVLQVIGNTCICCSVTASRGHKTQEDMELIVSQYAGESFSWLERLIVTQNNRS